MAEDKGTVERKRVFVRPPSKIKEMSDEELEQWAQDAILTPLMGPPEAEPKKSE